MSDLPEGWEWVTAGSITKVQGGIQKQPKRRPSSNPYPFLRVANVLRGRFDLNDVHEVELFDGEIDRYRLQPGDLLVVEGNGSPDQIGRAAQWHGEIEDCVHQNHLIRVRPSGVIDPRYLAYYWNAPQTTSYLRSVASSTSGLYVLTASKVRSVRIPLPPLDEQLRIIAIIEEQFSRLDVGFASLKRADQKIERLHRRSLSAIFDTKWPRVPMADVLTLISDCPHRTPKYSDDGAYPALRPRDVVGGSLKLGTSARVDAEEYRLQTARHVPTTGDIEGYAKLLLKK